MLDPHIAKVPDHDHVLNSWTLGRSALTGAGGRRPNRPDGPNVSTSGSMSARKAPLSQPMVISAAVSGVFVLYCGGGVMLPLRLASFVLLSCVDVK